MCEVAKSLGLKANNNMEKRLLEYLESNLSDILSFRIQSGNKTIQGAVEYIKNEVRSTIAKEQQKGSVGVWVDDEDVFGMLIHFFEEDSIDEPNKPKKSPTSNIPEPTKPEAVDNTIVMDLFAGDEDRPF